MEAEDAYQERFNRIFRVMIERLGQPLTTAQAAAERMVEGTGAPLPPHPTSMQPRTEQGQLVYQTLSQAEWIHQCLLALERVLLEKKEARMGPQTSGAPPMLNSMQAFSPFSAEAWNSVPEEEPIPAHEVDKATVESADVNEYNFRAMDDLSVPYTQMGLMTTLPDQRALTRKATGAEAPKKDIVGGIETDWDAPCQGKMQKVPWNSKVPVTLTVSIPKKRYYVGDKMDMQVEIHNMTDHKIKVLNCTLIKKSTSYVLSQGLRNVNAKKDEEVASLDVSPFGFPVKGRFRYKNRVFFKLPFSLAPTVSDGQSSFEVVYYLKVRAGSAKKNGPFVVLGPLKLEPRRI